MTRPVYLSDSRTIGRIYGDHSGATVKVINLDKLTLDVGNAMIEEFGGDEGQCVLDRLRAQTASPYEVTMVIGMFFRAITSQCGTINGEHVTSIIHADDAFDKDPVFGSLIKRAVRNNGDIVEIIYPHR